MPGSGRGRFAGSPPGPSEIPPGFPSGTCRARLGPRPARSRRPFRRTLLVRRLVAAGLCAADDAALLVDPRGHRLVGDRDVERAARALALHGARVAVEPGRDDVGDRVAARAHRREVPLERPARVRRHRAERPRPGVRGVAALRAAVDDPDRLLRVGEPRVARVLAERDGRAAAAGRLRLHRHGDVRDGLVVGVADLDAQLRAVGDVLLGRERRARDLDAELAFGLVLVLALRAAAAHQDGDERSGDPRDPHGGATLPPGGRRETQFRERRGEVALEPRDGRGAELGKRVEERADVPPRVVLVACELRSEVPAQVAGIGGGRAGAGLRPVDHAGETAVAPQRVAGVEVAVDERLGQVRRRPRRDLQRALPERVGGPEALELVVRRPAPERGGQRVDRAQRRGVLARRGAGRLPSEPREQERRRAAAVAVGVGGDDARELEREPLALEVREHRRLALGRQVRVLVAPLGPRPPPQHQLVHASARVPDVDRVVRVPPAAGERRGRQDLRARADRGGGPAERATVPVWLQPTPWHNLHALVRSVADRAFLPAKNMLEEVGDMMILTGKTVMSALRPPYPYGGEFVNQFLFALKLCWFPLVVSTVAFGYGAPGLQAANFLVLFGALDRLGGFFVLASIREFAPFVTAIVLAGVAGTAITADLGARKIREELDALQVLGVDPVKNLVVPRFLALMLVTGLFDVYAVISGITGSIVTTVVYDQPLGAFKATFLTNASVVDLWGSVLKCTLFGAIIAIVCCYKGMTATGGAAGVGRAVNHAFVIATLAVFAFNYVFTQPLLATHPEILNLK